MPTSTLLFSVLATARWSIGPFTVSDDDLYAIIGLIAAIATLTLWVAFEHLRQARRRTWPDASRDADAAEPESLVAAPPATSGTPVPARAEWLLADNTLVRMHAVPRGPLTPFASSPTESQTVDSARPSTAAGAPSKEPPAVDITGIHDDVNDVKDVKDVKDAKDAKDAMQDIEGA
jgi:hypothetical protein